MNPEQLRKAWARKQAAELAMMWIQALLYVAMMGGFAVVALKIGDRPRWTGVAAAAGLAVCALYAIVVTVLDTRKWLANQGAPLPGDAAAVLAEERSQRNAVLVQIAANLPVVAGIAFLGWRMHEIVFLYWMDAALAGVFLFVRLLRSEAQPAAVKEGGGSARGKYAAGVLFLLFYGLFALVLAMFLSALFPPTGAIGDGPWLSVVEVMGGILGQPGGLLAFLAMAAANVAAFRDYLRREAFRVDVAADVTAQAIFRLGGLMVFTGFGGFVVFNIGSTLATTAVFVAVRIFFELSRQRAEAQQAGVTSGP